MIMLQRRIENSTGIEQAKYLKMLQWLNHPVGPWQDSLPEAPSGALPFMTRLHQRVQDTTGAEQANYLAQRAWMDRPAGSWEDFKRQGRAAPGSAAGELSLAPSDESADIPLVPLDEGTYAALDQEFDEHVLRTGPARLSAGPGREGRGP